MTYLVIQISHWLISTCQQFVQTILSFTISSRTSCTITVCVSTASADNPPSLLSVHEHLSHLSRGPLSFRLSCRVRARLAVQRLFLRVALLSFLFSDRVQTPCLLISQALCLSLHHPWSSASTSDSDYHQIFEEQYGRRDCCRSLPPKYCLH